MQIKEPGFVATREAATTELDQLRKTASTHPDPQQGRLIRMTTTKAILQIMVATSIAQIAGILKNAKAELETKVKPIRNPAMRKQSIFTPGAEVTTKDGAGVLVKVKPGNLLKQDYN